MAENFYKQNGSYYLTSGRKVLNPTELQEYAKAGGKEIPPPTGSTSITDPPSIKRDDDGGISVLKNPLTQLQGTTGFLNGVKEVIKMKQGYNKDTTDAKNYWRTLQRDTSPFGGARDPKLQVAGMFTDESFREMSPQDQASIRASRDAAASSHLQGLREEETYRGTRIEDIVSALKDGMEEAERLSQSGLSDMSKALDILKKKQDAGLPITDEDYKKVGTIATGGKVGGSLSWRNNNLGNLKYSDWQKEYGATKDANSAFAVFPDEESAKKAYKALLTSQNKGAIYKDLSLNDAMWKWSGSGKDTSPSYRYDDLIKHGATGLLELEMKGMESFKDFGDQEWNNFFEAQRKAEGWTEGQALADNNVDPKIQYVADQNGIDIKELQTIFTDDEIINVVYPALLAEGKSDITDTATEERINTLVDRIAELESQYGSEDGSSIYSKLINENLSESETNLKKAMTVNRYVFRDGVWFKQ